MFHRIRKALKVKKQKRSETKDNSSGDVNKSEKDNDVQQDVDLQKSTKSNQSTQANTKGMKANNNDPQQKQVERTPEKIIEQLRIEILNEDSKISNLKEWLTTGSNIDEGINETKAILKRTSKLSESVQNTVKLLTSDTNSNKNMTDVFEFASRLPQIGIMFIPIRAIIGIVTTHEDVKFAIKGLWERLLTLLDQMTELLNWVNKKEMVGVGVEETQEKYLNLINECVGTMEKICDDREKKNLVQKSWCANGHINRITSLQNKIDSDLKQWSLLNGYKILYITTNNSERIDRIEERQIQNSEAIRSLGRDIKDIKQLHTDNLNTLEKVLDSFYEEDEILILDNITKEKFMDGTRQWIFDEFESWMHCTDMKKRVLILTAPAGFGKSQIAYQLVHKNRHDRAIAWHFVRYDSCRRSDPKRMLLSIAYQLSLHLSDYKLKLEDAIRNVTKSELLGEAYNLQDIFETFLQTPLSEMTSTKTFVIIIDALDECKNNHKNALLKCIKKYFCKLPVWLKVFITTRPEYPLMQELQNFDPMEINPSTDASNKEDLRKFFKNVLNHENYTLSNDLNVDRATTELVNKCDGLFMVAQFLVDAMKSNMDDLTFQDIKRLPNGTEEFYNQRFQESIFHNDDWSESIAWKVLQLIVVAKQPMTLLLIGNIIKCEEKDLRKAIEKLSLFLTLSNPDNKKITRNTRVSACHKSLVDWLTDTDREMEDFYVNIQKPNGLIGKYCIEFYDKEKITCIDTSTKYNKYTTLPTNFDYQSTIVDYIFQHGIQHLFDANMCKEARQILLSVGWILIAVQLKNPYDIVKDYELFERNDLVIHLIGRAIKLSSSIIQKKDWKQIPCQLVGRLYSSIRKRTTNDPIYIQLINFINRLKTFSYGFSWWCPIGPTWEQAETSCLKVFKRHNNPIRFVLFNPNATLVLSCDSRVYSNVDKRVSTFLLWDAKNDEIVNKFEIDGRVLAGSWSDVGLKVVTYCYISLDLTVWSLTMDGQPINLKTLPLGIQLNTIKNQYWWDIKVVISPNQNFVAIVGDEVNNIKIWNIVSEQIEISGIHQQQQSKWNDITWSPDGTRLATYSKDYNKISFWKLNIIESKLTFEYDISISNDGGRNYGFSYIDWSPIIPKVAVNHGSTIFIIDTENDNRQIVCQLPTRYFRHLVWSPVGTKLAIATTKTIEIWNINDDSNCKCDWKQDIRGSRISSLAWSKDGMKLLSGGSDRSVCIWPTIISSSTTKEYNQLPDYAIVEQEEKDNDNVDKNDIVRKNDSLDSFEPNEIDWKDLISEQRLQFIQKHQIITYEYVWFQYKHSMIVAHLYEYFDENNKKKYLVAHFWDPKTGKRLGYERFNTINDSVNENTEPTVKCASLFMERLGSNSFSYNEQTHCEITKEKIDLVYPDAEEERWSVHGEFAIEMNTNVTLNFFTLIPKN